MSGRRRREHTQMTHSVTLIPSSSLITKPDFDFSTLTISYVLFNWSYKSGLYPDLCD